MSSCNNIHFVTWIFNTTAQTKLSRIFKNMQWYAFVLSMPQNFNNLMDLKCSICKHFWIVKVAKKGDRLWRYYFLGRLSIPQWTEWKCVHAHISYLVVCVQNGMKVENVSYSSSCFTWKDVSYKRKKNKTERKNESWRDRMKKGSLFILYYK